MTQEFDNSFLKSKLKYLYGQQQQIPKLIEIDEEKLKQTWDEHFVKVPLLVRQKPNEGQNYEMEEIREFEVENIFEDDNSLAMRKMLFLGGGGTGKSTFLHYISYKWGKEALWNERFDFIFRIRLNKLLNKDWKSDYDTVKELRVNKLYCFIHHNLKLQYLDLEENGTEIPDEEQISISELIELKDKSKVLLLVDGYNEVSHLASRNDVDFREIMKSISMHNFSITSSRPNAFKVNEMQQFDVILECKNLDFDSVSRYINSFYSDDDILGIDFISFLERNHHVSGICEIPINMVLLCLIWADEDVRKTFDHNSDINIQLLYHQVILWLGKKYLINFENWDAENIVPSTVFEQEIIQFLQKIAFDSFVEQGNFVNNRLIRKYLGKLNIANIYKFGILKAVGIKTDIVNLDFQFIHPTFQEFLTALHLNDKLASKIEKEVVYSCNLIGHHRNEPKYLVVLKFLAGIVSSQQFEDDERKDNLIEKTWEAFTCNVDRMLEFCLETKITVLMHLLEQSKINGTYDERIPNLGKIVTFIDTEILFDLTKWHRQIIESGYISTEIKKRIEIVFEDITKVDELNLMVTVDILTSLVNKIDHGAKHGVLQKIMKVLSLQNWQLQKLALTRLKQLIDSRISEDILKEILNIEIWFLNDNNLAVCAADLSIKIVCLFPSFVYDILKYLNLIIEDVDFDTGNKNSLSSSFVDFILETLSHVPKDICFDIVNAFFEMLKFLFLKLKCDYIVHARVVDALLTIIRFLAIDQTKEKVVDIFDFFEILILDSTANEYFKCNVLKAIVKLMKFVPENEISERVDKTLRLFEKCLNSSESHFWVKINILKDLPEFINVVPNELITEKVKEAFNLYELVFQNPDKDELFIFLFVYNAPIFVKFVPKSDQLKMTFKSLDILNELLTKNTAKLPQFNLFYTNCILKFIETVLENDLVSHFDKSIELFNSLCEKINDEGVNKDFKEMLVHGIFQLLITVPQNQTGEMLFQPSISNKDNNQNHQKTEILTVIPQKIEATLEINAKDEAKPLTYLKVMQDLNPDVLNIKMPLTRSVFNLSIIPTVLEIEPEILLHRLNDWRKCDDEISTNKVTEFILIPNFAHLSEIREEEKENYVFSLLTYKMKDLFFKWKPSDNVEALFKQIFDKQTSDTVNLEFFNHNMKIIVLDNVPLEEAEIMELSAKGKFKVYENVFNSATVDFNAKFEAVGGLLQLCDELTEERQKSRLPFTAAFHTLCAVLKDDRFLNYSKSVAVNNLTKLLKEMPKEQASEVGAETVDILIDVVLNPAYDTTLRIPALNGVISAIKLMSENEETLLNDVLKKFDAFLLKDATSEDRFVLIQGLPGFATLVKKCGNEILTLLEKVLERGTDNFAQGEARLSIASFVEKYAEADRDQIAKQAFEILSNRNDDFSKYFGIAQIECLAKIAKAMALVDSVELLSHDVVNVREGAKIGILDRLTASEATFHTDYKQIVSLLKVLNCCRERKETIDKALFTAATVKIKQIAENITDDGIAWVIDNFSILTQFEEVKVVVKCMYHKLLGKINEQNYVVSENAYVFITKCIKYGLATTIQRTLNNKSGGGQYNYQIMFEDVTCEISNFKKTDLDIVISTALQLKNALSKQYREYQPIFINSSQHGLPIAAFDVKIYSLVDDTCALHSENWHMALLHLSDQNKNQPSSVFALMEKRDHFGYYLIYKVHLAFDKLSVTPFAVHPNEITTKFREEIFGEMHYDIKRLIKPRFYASVISSLKEGEALLQKLHHCEVSKCGTEHDILHELFKDYFINVEWGIYKDEEHIVELRKDLLLKLDTSDRKTARRESETIDNFVGVKILEEQQEKLLENVDLLKGMINSNHITSQEDKIKILGIINNLNASIKSLDKTNSEQQQRIVEITKTLHVVLTEGEFTAEKIISLEEQCEQLKSTNIQNPQLNISNIQTPQLNIPNVNHFGSEEINTDDNEDYLGLR